MKLIIIEGTDNIGKDTLINKLIENFETVTLIHCGSPKSKVFQSQEQDNLFLNYAYNIKTGLYDYTDCIIMNRSHIGEYVYGQIYRNRNPDNIIKMINKVDSILLSREDLVVKYIQLLSSSIELRIKNDDNKSLSDMNKPLMFKENDLFTDIYHNSSLDKTIIYVNDEDNFLDKDEIYNEAIKFLNS